MSDVTNVLVLAGGLSLEREVSITSGRRIADALRGMDVDVHVSDPGAGLIEQLRADRPQAVFVALHGSRGEDGTVQEVLELGGVPYVGGTAEACRLAYDKATAKSLVRRAGLATPLSVTLAGDAFRDFDARALTAEVVDALGLPLVVKPCRGGSGLGVTAVEDAAAVAPAIMTSLQYGDTALIERYVEGTELAVTVADRGDGPQALPAVQVQPPGRVYDYEAHYTPGLTEVVAPPQLPDDIVQRALDAAVTAHVALGLRDLSRTDFVVGSDGVPQFLETAVSPGFTYTSVLPPALEAAGVDLGRFALDLLLAAVNRGGALAS